MSLQDNMAAFIKEVMKRENKSLTEYAEELEISWNSLYDYITGGGNPTLSTLGHIAERMGVSPAALILGILDLDQREIMLMLADTVQDVARLPKEKRMRFVELFLEMAALWDDVE